MSGGSREYGGWVGVGANFEVFSRIRDQDFGEGGYRDFVWGVVSLQLFNLVQ